jgi:hypothetical protein
MRGWVILHHDVSESSGSHLTYDTITTCSNNLIWGYGLPPHESYMLQLLDVLKLIF